MRFYLDRFLKYRLAYAVLMIAVILTAGSSTAVFAQRYHDQEEMDSGYSVICTQNHLREDCWYQEDSFMYYTEEGFTSRVGVDVSKWNKDVDFAALKEQGVEFVIIRVGFRGYQNGELVVDERFYEFMDEAAAAGLEIGVYFYSQAIDEDEAAEEALFVVDHLAGYDISMPVYFDTEDVRQGEARTQDLSTANYILNAKAFCETVESMGYSSGVYASQEWIRKNLDLAQLSDYEIWYALYNSTPGREYGFDMWQYTDMGELEGCDTSLDMNIRVEKVP